MTCADCDCGPLGWHDTQGRDLAASVEEDLSASSHGEKLDEKQPRPAVIEFLLDVRRVRYAVA